MSRLARSLRAKEKAEYETYVGEARANIEAMTGAIAALEKGMGRTFLQSKDTAARLRKVQEEASGCFTILLCVNGCFSRL